MRTTTYKHRFFLGHSCKTQVVTGYKFIKKKIRQTAILYVPNGSAAGSDKYACKLNWLSKIREFIRDELSRHPRLVVLGDMNIAPEDGDVHDPEAWREQILCSTPERESFWKLLPLGLADASRQFEQPEARFSWWDYRSDSFRRKMGLRIDPILVSPMLLSECKSCLIDKLPRKLQRPSDHAPILAEFRK